MTDTRILFVHAHPDDESIATGIAIAGLTRLGAQVHVVTCTLGEEGEVIGRKYQDLISAKADQLGGYRISELREALTKLGLEQRPSLLGGAFRWRDSGMVGMPTIEHPRAFSGDDMANEVLQVSQLRMIIEARQPHIVITYGPDGGYGHPDHIRAHRITHAAMNGQLGEANDGAWVPDEVWWAVTPQEVYQDAVARARVGAKELPPKGWRWPEKGEIALVPESEIDAFIVGTAEDLAAKTAAMAAHATQLWVADGTTSDVNPQARYQQVGDGPALFALSNMVAQPVMAVEGYQVGWRSPEVQGRQLGLLKFGIVTTQLPEKREGWA